MQLCVCEREKSVHLAYIKHLFHTTVLQGLVLLDFKNKPATSKTGNGLTSLNSQESLNVESRFYTFSTSQPSSWQVASMFQPFFFQKFPQAGLVPSSSPFIRPHLEFLIFWSPSPISFFKGC